MRLEKLTWPLFRSWCPFCNLQLSNLRKIQQNLKELGYQMIAISGRRGRRGRRLRYPHETISEISNLD